MNDSIRNDDHGEVHEEPRVMSENDVHDYQGLTLNEDGEEEKKEEPSGGFTIHVESFDFKTMTLWKKALFFLGGAACVGAFLLLAVVAAGIFVIGGGIILAAGCILYLIRKYIL